MIIHGKERKFLCTVEAVEDISSICRDGNIENLMEVFEEGTVTDKIGKIIDLVLALNKGYEKSKAFEELGYVPDVITKEELKAVPIKMMTEIQNEAIEAISFGMGITVETEPEKN